MQAGVWKKLHFMADSGHDTQVHDTQVVAFELVLYQEANELVHVVRAELEVCYAPTVDSPLDHEEVVEVVELVKVVCVV